MDKNTKTLAVILGVVVCMVGLAFASVPLYNLFCKVTGFGGTTQTAQALPDHVINREVTIKFNADTSPNLPWEFAPDQREVTIKLGQEGLISYHAFNKLNTPTKGTAVYNVTPNKVGQYFHKIQCFCFSNQTLTPKQKMNMPVVFYVDPALNDDRSLDDVKTITLSYTFFPAETEELDQALEQFYNTP